MLKGVDGPFNIQSFRFECNDAMHIHNYDSSFCFWVFEKRLTQKNCFLFCKSMVCLTVLIFLLIDKFLLSTFQTFMVSVQGGQDLKISYQKQSCFSHGEGSFKEPIHKQFYSK